MVLILNFPLHLFSVHEQSIHAETTIYQNAQPGECPSRYLTGLPPPTLHVAVKIVTHIPILLNLKHPLRGPLPEATPTESDRIRLDSVGFGWIRLDSVGFGRIRSESIGFDRNRSDSIGIDLIRSDLVGFSWSSRSWEGTV